MIIATIVSTLMCGSELRDQSTSNANLARVFPVSSFPTLCPDPTTHICQKHELIALLHFCSHCGASARRWKLIQSGSAGVGQPDFHFQDV